MKSTPGDREVPQKLPTEEEIENMDLALTSKTLEQQVTEKFTNNQIKILKKIVYYTSQVGLTIEEACTLANFSFQELEEIMIREPLVKKIITIKELEFKKDMLHTLTIRARGGDDKLAQWLLERKYPDQYASGKHRGSDNGEKNYLFQAIEFIQRNGDANPLVPDANSKTVVIRQGAIKQVTDVLV